MTSAVMPDTLAMRHRASSATVNVFYVVVSDIQ